ncbi:MAG: alpha-amylase family glycosyl hydrolase [bacterium]|nr:alpha-amylase family glycosyl hydrolase [bacterium]
MRSIKSLKDITLPIPENAYPSPYDWRDEIIYSLIVDRFSDGNEKERPLYDPEKHKNNALKDDGGAKWAAEGLKWQGGTFKGIKSKLDYLRKLGITALWLSPVFRQRKITAENEKYGEVNFHGYSIQNFLDTDPHFGTKEELRDLVKSAHKKGIRIILDIVHNHTGNNWYYKGYESPELLGESPDFRLEEREFGGWRSERHDGQIKDEEDGVWPVEFQNPDWYWRKGSIKNWDTYPDFIEGDFFVSKSLKHANPEVLDALIKIYRYWMWYTDCDGFRIDAAKHVGIDASTKFCNAIREYAELIGKKNFLLMGEVAGSEDLAKQFLANATEAGLSAILDINGPPRSLEKVIKGFEHPFSLYTYYTAKSNLPLASHREIGKYHVSILDDHDQVWRYPEEGKARFSADNPFWQQTVLATGFQMCSLGIPAIYYGTEQNFDGKGGKPHFDRWIRECMFGGEFGAMRTKGVHFFNENNPTYKQISKLCEIRKKEPALRYGRQYFRKISWDGRNFVWPGAKQVIAWSRILAGEEIIAAINTNAEESMTFCINIEKDLHAADSVWEALFSNCSEEDRQDKFISEQHEGYASVKITLSPCSMIIIKRKS